MALTRVAAILPLSGGRRGLPEGTCPLAAVGVVYLRELAA